MTDLNASKLESIDEYCRFITPSDSRDKSRINEAVRRLLDANIIGLSDLIEKLHSRITELEDNYPCENSIREEVESKFDNKRERLFDWFLDNFENTVRVTKVLKEEYYILTSNQWNKLKSKAHDCLD